MRAILYCILGILCVGSHVRAQSVSPKASVSPTTSSTLNATSAASQNSTVKTAGTTVASTTSDQCWGKKSWQDKLIDVTCTTQSCATDRFLAFSLYMTCNEKHLQSDLTEWKEIAERVYDYGTSVATTFRSTSPSSLLGNGSISFITNHFLVESGFLNRERSDLRFHSILPNYMAGAAPSYTGKKDSIKFAMLTLNPGVAAYTLVLYKNLISTKTLLKFTTEKPSIVTKLETLGRYSWPTTRSGKWVLNSQIARIGFTPTPSALTEPFDITFNHIELMKRINHECIVLSGNIDNSRAVWSTSGCHRIFTDRFQTVCRCNSPGVIAVISQIEEVISSSGGFSRTSITLVAVALSIFVIFGLMCSILYPVIKGYYHLIRVQLFWFHDIAALMVYLMFIIGVAVSNNTQYADSVAGCIHFFQTSVISWVFVEGIHNYHLLNPVYDAEVTSALFFYNTIGWGIPAALSGSCAGYPYNLESAEFSWMKVSGSGLAYFLVGPLASVLAILVIYLMIFYELRSWIGSKRDYQYRKCLEYYKRNSLVFIIAFLTWYTGILARNHTTKLFYTYLFLAMYGSQGASLIYLHFLRNTEIMEYRSKQHSDTKNPEKIEVEETSIYGDGATSLFSSMKSLVSLRSRTLSRSSEAVPGPSTNNERYAETKFDGEESEGVPGSSSYHNNDGTSSDSSSDNEDDIDKVPRARSMDFSVYQIDESEEGGDNMEVPSQLMAQELSTEESFSRQDEPGNNDYTEEQIQGQGYEEESGMNLDGDSNEGENRLEGQSSMGDSKYEGFGMDEGREFKMNEREEEGIHLNEDVTTGEGERPEEREENFQEDIEKSGDNDEKFSHADEGLIDGVNEEY